MKFKVGDNVVYRNGPKQEFGVVTRMPEEYVFVRFGEEVASKACYERNLELQSEGREESGGK